MESSFDARVENDDYHSVGLQSFRRI